jgi:hypothetical protein
MISYIIINFNRIKNYYKKYVYKLLLEHMKLTLEKKEERRKMAASARFINEMMENSKDVIATLIINIDDINDNISDITCGIYIVPDNKDKEIIYLRSFTRTILNIYIGALKKIHPDITNKKLQHYLDELIAVSLGDQSKKEEKYH